MVFKFSKHLINNRDLYAWSEMYVRQEKQSPGLVLKGLMRN